VSDAVNLVRAAKGIVETDRPLSPEFRKQLGTMLNSLRLCIIHLEYEEEDAIEHGRRYNAPGLSAIRALIK